MAPVIGADARDVRDTVGVLEHGRLGRDEAGERPVVFGDGGQQYDFVSVTDVARCNVLAMHGDDGANSTAGRTTRRLR